MTPIPRLGATLITLLLALLLAAVPASAATVTGASTDPADSSGPAGSDVLALDVAYDDAGTATATLTFDSATGSESDLAFVALGTTTASGSCVLDGPAALGMGARTDGTRPGWVSYVNGASEDGADAPDRSTGIVVTRDGARFTVTVSDPRIASRGYTCALARVSIGGESVDDVAPFPLAAPTPAPPAPTPAPPAPTPAPTPAKPAPQLRAALKGIPARVKRGQRIRPTLTIANRGTARSEALTVRIKSARGLSVRPRTVKVRALAPGRAKRVKLRVSLTRKARAATPFVVSARGGGLTATARETLRLRAKPKPKPTKGGLPGTFWWWNEFTANTPFNVFSLRFYGNGYAYYRLPGDGQSVPDRCDSVTSVPDADGEYGPGCVKWDLKGNQLTFSDPRFTGTFENGRLSIRDAEKAYEVDRLAEPRAGKRFNFSYKNIETTGVCGPFSFCSNTQSYLTLQADGQFGLQEQSNSSLDTGGGFTAAGSYPPESRGTYEVLSGYRIRLSYADGKTEIVPFGIVEGTSAVDSNVRVIVGRLPYWMPDEDD